MKKTVCGLTPDELKEEIVNAGFPAYRANQILDWVYKKNAMDWSEIKNISEKDILKLKESLDISHLKFPDQGLLAGRESVKVLFETHDGHLLESVLISQSDRQTVCVSTQLGCKIGCSFCASGKGLFARNLSAGEIVEQVLRIQKETGEKVTNVVFMGMGEPLDNFENTMKALDILMEEWGLGLGGRRITVSTSGITPKILEFVEKVDGRVRLSVSLHSSKPEVRDELVPINKKYTLKNLGETLDRIHKTLKREITFEYTLIKDINDSDEEAKGVADIAIPLKAKVNLIPYNPIQEMEYGTPSQEKIERFQRLLERKGVKTTLRQTAGREIDAACGQLRLDRMGSIKRP